MWKYRTGDVVRHVEYGPELIGVILEPKIGTEIIGDEDDNPYYVIRWICTPDGSGYSVGQEHELQLELVDKFYNI